MNVCALWRNRKAETERMKPEKETARACRFQTNEFYETLLRRQREDRELYERTFSPALRLSVEFYATTKRKNKEVKTI
jgi:hypothetical protein